MRDEKNTENTSAPKKRRTTPVKTYYSFDDANENKIISDFFKQRKIKSPTENEPKNNKIKKMPGFY